MEGVYLKCCPYYDVPGPWQLPGSGYNARVGTVWYRAAVSSPPGAVSCDVTSVTSGPLVTPTSQQHAPTITSNTFPCLSKYFNSPLPGDMLTKIELFSPSKLSAKTKVSTSIQV